MELSLLIYRKGLSMDPWSPREDDLPGSKWPGATLILEDSQRALTAQKRQGKGSLPTPARCAFRAENQENKRWLFSGKRRGDCDCPVLRLRRRMIEPEGLGPAASCTRGQEFSAIRPRM